MKVNATGHRILPLPPPDGAPYICGAIVEKPKPVWWGRCENPGTCTVEGYLPSVRCDEHVDTP